MLPGISSVLRRERRPTSESSGPHSPQLSAVPSAPLPQLPSAPGSAGGAQLSSSASARRAAALVASAREAQAASAAARQGNSYGDDGPMLPEELRARERERERAMRQQISGGSSQSAAGSSRGERAGRESQSSDGASGPRYSSSHMESSVTRLLVATKMLLEALTKWSTGQRTETQVSDIYVRLGNDFNTANHAFGSYGIDMSDLASVPDDLRACLERCLSEDASPQVLEVHLPPIREIIINLLQGLKLKQAEYKQYLLAQRTAGGGGGSGHRSRGSRSERSNTSEDVSGHRRSTTGSISRRPVAPPPVQPSSRPGSMVASPTISSGLSEHDEPRRRGTGGSGSGREAGMTPQASTDGSTVYESLREEEEDAPAAPAGRRAPNDVVRHSLVDGPQPDSAKEEVVTPTNSLQQIASTSAVQTPVTATSPPLSSATRTPGSARGRRAIAAANAAADAESDPSLRALKSRDALERRASKRFSAYTFNKMGVGTPQGFGLGMGLSSLGGAAMAMQSPSSSPLAERRPTADTQRAGKRLMRGISGGPPSDAASSGDEARRPRAGEGADADGLARSESEELTPGPLNGKTRFSPHPSPRVQGALGLAPPPPGAHNAAASSTESLPFVDAAAPSPPSPYAQIGEVPPVPPLPTGAERRKLDAAQARAAAPASDTLSLFLQLGRQTRRAQLELLPGVAGRGLSVGKLRMLFVDRFAYSPGKEDFPTIYVKDVPSGVSYELEDLNELQDGAVLTLNIEPLDQVKQHLDLVLGTITRELRDLKSAVHDRDRDREANRRASVNYASDALAAVNAAAAEAGPSSRITDSQFTSAGARVAQQLKRAGTLREEANEGVNSPTMSTASHSSGATSGARIAGELKHQYDEVQALRRELAVLRQIQSEFGADVGGLLAKLREQSARVRAIASAEVPAERNFIIAGKARLDGNSQEVLTLVEDLQDTVDDLKLDVINRGVKPKPALMRKVGEDIARATRGLEELEKYVETVKPSWKKTWEAELQNIVDEQEFLNHQEGLIADLRDDHGALQDVYENIQQVVKLRGVGRPSGAGGKGFLPPPPEEGHEGLSTVMLEVRGQSVDHEKRLKALHAAERLRAKEIASRTDEFTDELSGFVEGKALRKTGGHIEAERVRSRRDQQTMRAMFSGGADAIGGAPGAMAAVRPPPKLLLGGGGKATSREGPTSPLDDASSPVLDGDA